MSVYIGCDIGTVSIKAAVLVDDACWPLCSDSDGLRELHGAGQRPENLHIYLSPYRRLLGSPAEAAVRLIDDILARLPADANGSIALTGAGAARVAALAGFGCHSEYKALATGVSALHPDVETILEMGGENSKYLRVHAPGGTLRASIVDYGSNGDCAAGTGSFMDQQATRLCYEIEEIGAIVEGVTRSAHIAGRCSVFAKSDMIHAQQRGASPPQILKGLCEAVAGNFKASVIRGRPLAGRIAFVGGVANNSGVAGALRQALGAEDAAFFVPAEPAYYAAVGAALLGRENGGGERPLQVAWPARQAEQSFPCWPPLDMTGVRPLAAVAQRDAGAAADNEPIDAYLGLDIGSVSTNLVLMDEHAGVLHEIYVKTRARPVEVVGQCLQEVAERFGGRVRVRGVGTTGSGRELIGALIGADSVNDEITAHKTGAAHVAGQFLDRQVDTIFEIGGQDSKFIRLQEGVVTDFAMNEACAAGTGSFLEEQAEKLGISIVGEFARLAFASTAPIRLGERCTVYMGMDVTARLRTGAGRKDVIAGLAYSVAQNYLNRVVRGRPLGEVVFFQGGTAYNHAVAAALAAITGKTIIIPPHNGVMGAYGAALLARRRMLAAERPSAFRGFDLEKIDYRVHEFTCAGCANHCSIQQFTIEGEKSYWGDKCSERFRKPAKVERQPVVEDLRAHYLEALERDWLEEFRRGNHGATLQALAGRVAARRRRLSAPHRFGMLRAMIFFHRHPFWKGYLEALGGQVTVSGATTGAIAEAGIAGAVAEPCFPIQVAHGHFTEALAQDVDQVVIPALINEATDDLSVQSYACPFSQALPFLLRNSPLAAGTEGRFVAPLVHFRMGEKFVERQLWEHFRARAESREHHREAVRLGFAAQEAFHREVGERGRRALAGLERSGGKAVALIGRPYNIYDPGLNINLVAKLRTEYGLNVLPLDYLPAENESLEGLHGNMYWHCGSRILRSVLWASRRDDLHLIYLTNFLCGPDSFLKTFVAEGAGKPFLVLQFDAHGNDAGMVTRVEAYLDSKGML